MVEVVGIVVQPVSGDTDRLLFSQPTTLNQICQSTGDDLASNLQMRGGKFGCHKVVPAKPEDFGVRYGHRGPLQ